MIKWNTSIRLPGRSVMWRRILACLTAFTVLILVFSRLPSAAGALAVVGLAAVAGLLVTSLRDRFPLELCFLMFIGLMPATRLSVLNVDFSLQANYVAIAAVAALLVWRAGMLKVPLLLPPSPITVAVLILFLVIALSFPLSAQVSPGEYRGEVRYMRSAKQIVQFILMMATYLVILLTVQGRRLFRWSIWVLVGASFLYSLYGLYQFIGYQLGLPYIDLFPDSASFGSSVRYTESFAGFTFLRIWSVASEPTWFGDYLSGAIPLTAALFLGDVGLSTRARLALGVALATMVGAVLVTFTRSAYLALIVAVALLLVFHGRWLRKRVAIMTSALVLLAVLGLFVAQFTSLDVSSLTKAVQTRFMSVFAEEHFGNIHKATAVSASWEMFRDRPWGVGYGNYGFFFYDYQPGWGSSMTDKAHMLDTFPVTTGGFLLRLLTETGIPGVLAFAWLIVVVAREGLRTRKLVRHDGFMLASATGLLVGFLTLMVRLQFGSSIHFTYQWLFLAMIVVCARLGQRDSAEPALEVA